MPVNAENIISSKEAPYDIPEKFLGQFIFEEINRLPNDFTLETEFETGKHHTVGNVIRQAKNIAKFLVKNGIAQDDFVSIFMDNVLEYTPLALGTLWSGAIFTFIRPQMIGDTTYDKLFEKCKVIFVDGQDRKQLLIKAAFGGKIVDVADLFPGLEEHADLDVSIPVPIKGSPSTVPAVVGLTGGTTGKPKLPMYSHRVFVGLTVLDKLWSRMTNVQKPHTVTTAFNSSHIAAFITRIIRVGLGYHLVLFNGGNLVLKHLEAVPKYRVNAFNIMPIPLVGMMRNPDFKKYDLRSLNTLNLYGGSTTEKLFYAIKDAFQVDTIYCKLIMSENAGAVMLFSDKPATCGRIAPNIKAKVIDIHTGKTLGPRQIGELCFAGESGILRYFDNPKKTSEAIDKDGFHHTGDLVYYDEEELFHYVDRDDEVIKTKTGFVSSTELELATIMSEPTIREASVLSVPDPTGSGFQVPRIIVIPAVWPTNEEAFKMSVVKTVEKECGCAISGGIELRKDVPRTLMGKPQKRALLDEYLKLK